MLVEQDWAQARKRAQHHSNASSSKEVRTIWISTPKQLIMGFPKDPHPLPVNSLLQCLHKGTGRSEQQWFKQGVYACRQRTYLQNSQWHPHGNPGAAWKGVKLVQRDRVRNQSKQGWSPVVHHQQQTSRTSNASSLLQWRSHTKSLRYLGIHFNRMLTFTTRTESTKLRYKKGIYALKGHLFLLYRSVILSVIDYGLGLTTLSRYNLLRLNRVQNEAVRVILRTTKDTQWWHALPTGPAIRGNNNNNNNNRI